MARATKTTRAPQRARRERGSITAEVIIDGAFELAEEVTVDNLSMPVLAKRLDMGVTSIYWHFRSKDLLLDAMTERALHQYNFGTPSFGPEKWYDALRTHAQTMRALFRANPVICDLLLTRVASYGLQSNHVVFDRLEGVVASLVDAGFTPEDALDVFFSISVHTRGVVLLERKQDLDNLSSPRIATENVDADAMPYLSGLLEARYPVGVVDSRTFEIGLDALIDRARKVLRATDKSKSTTTKAKTARR